MVLRKMKIKSANLKDTQLDWAVAKCEGYHCVVLNDGYSVGINRDRVIDYFNPSINWGWSGPIIEREHIDVSSSYSAHFPNQPWQYRAEKDTLGSTIKQGGIWRLEIHFLKQQCVVMLPANLAMKLKYQWN